jgi:acyl-CoA synthetase (NDP forming)
MVSSIRAFKLLTGVRGEKKTDLQSISDVLKRVSQLVTDVQEIKELDINPLIARTEGNGSIAVDVRIVI